MANGLSAPIIPENFAKFSNGEISDIKHYSQFPKNYFYENKYENKKILIIGGGNSAYELYNMLYKTASEIIIAKRDTITLPNYYFGNLHYLNGIMNEATIDINIIDRLHVDKIDGKYFVFFVFLL